MFHEVSLEIELGDGLQDLRIIVAGLIQYILNAGFPIEFCEDILDLGRKLLGMFFKNHLRVNN